MSLVKEDKWGGAHFVCLFNDCLLHNQLPDVRFFCSCDSCLSLLGPDMYNVQDGILVGEDCGLYRSFQIFEICKMSIPMTKYMPAPLMITTSINHRCRYNKTKNLHNGRHNDLSQDKLMPCP